MVFYVLYCHLMPLGEFHCVCQHIHGGSAFCGLWFPAAASSMVRTSPPYAHTSRTCFLTLLHPGVLFHQKDTGSPWRIPGLRCLLFVTLRMMASAMSADTNPSFSRSSVVTDIGAKGAIFMSSIDPRFWGLGSPMNPPKNL